MESENPPKTTDSHTRPLIEHGTVIDGYKIIRILGRGGYSDLYLVLEISTNKYYAMKIERFDNIKHSLENEIELFKFVGQSFLLPKFITTGKTDEFLYAVIELLGPSVTLVKFKLPDKKFDIYTVLKLSFEMLRCIQDFHRHGFIHRDIKPSNFLFRNSEKNPLVLVDFGLSTRLYDRNNQHIPFRKDAGFIGTSSFCSPNAYKQVQLSRRDDLYSWFYSVLDICDGKVPWPGRADKPLTQKMKLETKPEDLCKNLPPIFIDIYNDITKLKFKEKPNYKFIRDSIQQCMNDMSPKPEKFQWLAMPESTIQEISAISLDPEKKVIYSEKHSHKAKDKHKEEEDGGKECRI